MLNRAHVDFIARHDAKATVIILQQLDKAFFGKSFLSRDLCLGEVDYNPRQD